MIRTPGSALVLVLLQAPALPGCGGGDESGREERTTLAALAERSALLIRAGGDGDRRIVLATVEAGRTADGDCPVLDFAAEFDGEPMSIEPGGANRGQDLGGNGSVACTAPRAELDVAGEPARSGDLRLHDASGEYLASFAFEATTPELVAPDVLVPGDTSEVTWAPAPGNNCSVTSVELVRDASRVPVFLVGPQDIERTDDGFSFPVPADVTPGAGTLIIDVEKCWIPVLTSSSCEGVATCDFRLEDGVTRDLFELPVEVGP